MKNIPKGQFIRIRRICSEKEDFQRNCKMMSTFFVKRGYQPQELNHAIDEVSRIDRSELLNDKPREKKDPQVIFVCDWHPNLSMVPSILKKNFHLLENDTKTSKIFTSQPLVAFRRPRSIKNILVKNDILPKEEKPVSTQPCGNCILCKNIWTTEIIRNKNIEIEIKDGGNCQTRGVIYAARCKKCDELCIGQTHKSTNLRFSGHRYDIKRRPEKENTELATHFSRCDHDFEKDMEVLILQSGLNKSKEEREFHEDRWICRLQTLKPSGINEKLNGYAKEMYQCFTKLHSSK